MSEPWTVTAPDRSAIRHWAKLRLWVGYLYLLCAVVLARPLPIWTALGLLLVLAGIALRVVAAATLVKDTRLCTDGVYSLTRNPLYLGSALIGLGFASLTASLWFLLAFAVVLAPIYWRMIILEETYLTELHPDIFPSYRRSVPRFLPRLPNLRTLAAALDTAQLRETREISSAVLIALLVGILLAWHRSWLAP